MSFIDIHCHILPGVDDGPEDIGESIRMAEMAFKDGISHICATPHIMDGLYDNKASRIAEAIDELRGRIACGIGILFGADVRITLDIIDRIRREEIPTLNDSGFLLIELPPYIIPPNMDTLMLNFRRREITPIITHPERHLRLMNNPSVIVNLKAMGAMVQITAMSITGGFGNDVRRAALNMLKGGVVDFVASDAHDTHRRPPILSKAYDEVGRQFGRDTAERLFIENPRRVIEAGLQVPGA